MEEVAESKATSLTKIYKLIDDKKFKQAFPYALDIKSVADKGDAAAQYYLGLLLISNKENGEGGKYLKLSVEQNYLPAIRTCLFDKVTSGFKNNNDANCILLRKLMEIGDVNATCVYAWFKLLDALDKFAKIFRGIPKEMEKTRNLGVRVTPSQLISMERMVSWYDRRKEIYSDCREAFTMLYKAAEKQNSLSLYMLSEMYRVGISYNIQGKPGIRNADNGAIVHSDEDRARELLVRGANAGNILCILKLMRMYSDAEALRLLEIAREKYNNAELNEMKGLFALRRFEGLERVKLCEDAEFTGVRSGLAIVGSEDEWNYIRGDTNELPDRYRGLKPSMLMQSGVIGIVETSPLPSFLTSRYNQFVKEIKEEAEERLREAEESSPEYKKKQRERAEKEEARQEAIRQAKERKDAILGCGCLLAVAAAVGFFIWWWLEGLTMSALPGMWEQAKNMLGGNALGTIAKIGGVVVALLIVWSLIKGIKGKKDEVSTSPKKRWKFVVLGILFGFFGIHLAYAKRWLLFLLLWAGFITGNVASGGKSENDVEPDDPNVAAVSQSENAEKKDGSPLSGIGFAVWGLLWIGGTLFIKKDGKGNRM